ncbi:TonB-dependent receptor domain-containing protein [Ferruginibacter yonginensis]|uniref:TonB-dependent receptor domain-containing protein n=1 Tax=Ferruginibacter yonginensis TaxID=1310416 RepID=A0ABV8QSQ3_9BACT
MIKKCFTLLCIFLCNAAVFAQVDLTVSVSNNATLKPLASVAVVLQNKEIGYNQTLSTNAAGKVIFKSLSIAGTYTVSLNSESYNADVIDNLQFRTNENPSVQLVATTKKTTELNAVKVYSGSSKINTVNAEVSAQLKRKELELLPVEGRDITRSLYRLPNVTQATGFYPEAPNVSINGANSLFTSYLIDGMDNNERFLGGQKFAMPLGFTQNVTALTNNYSVEFGNTANGLFNLTSRSGSNKTTGEAFYLTRPGAAVDASSKYFQKDLSGNNVKDGFQRQQFGVALGGAIKKDKTFYYINAEQTIDIKDNILTSPQLGVNATVRGYNYFTYLSGKIDQKWSDHFKSSLRVNGGIVNIARQGGGLEGGVAFPSAGNKQDRNSTLIALQNVYTKGNISNETNIQYSNFRWNYARPTNENNPQVEVKAPDGSTVAVFGHPGYAFDSHESTIQFQEKFKIFLNKHTLKVGAEIISAKHQLYGGGVPNGYYQVQLTAAQLADLKAKNKGKDLDYTDIPSNVAVPFYSVELRPNQFGKTQTITSLYAEDLFAVNSKLNITYGIRYDYDNLSKGGSSRGDYNNIAPRASFNYKINDKSSIRGGSGLSYDKVLYSVYSDAIQQNTTSPEYKLQLQALIDKGILPKNTNLNAITFDGNLSAGATNVPYLNGPSAASLQNQRNSVFSFERRILNPNGYQNSYTWQNTIGYQYQVNDKLLLYTDVVYNRGYNLFRLVDLNAPTAYQIPANGTTPRSQAAANATRPVPIFNDASGNYGVINGQKVYGVARNVTVTDAGGKSEYIGLSINAKKDKAADKYAYFVSYTLSSLKNNTDDINFRASDANNYDNEWGPSLNDRRHVISGVFYYYPVKQLSVSFATLLQSGQPINRIPDGTVYGTTDLNGDGGSFGDAYVGNSDRQPGEARNSDRLPWSKLFDAGVQYNIPIKGTGRLEIRADIFNVFNTVNLSGYSNNATQSNQIQIGPKSNGILQKNAGAPRQFQFGARYTF